MSRPKALIFGVGGQDGSYLARELLGLGWEVHGLYRHSSINNLTRVADLLQPEPLITLHRGDVTDPFSVGAALHACRPDAVYNEADQDNVGWSRDVPAYARDVTYGGAAVVLETVRRLCPTARVFQPCSATMFGPAAGAANEDTPFDPRSPYAVGKVAAYHLARYYRREYGMHVSTGILFNHDSPLRTEQYLMHKLARGALRAVTGRQDGLAFGNPDQVVDVGWAPEFVTAIRMIMGLQQPDDYVVGTGCGVSVGDLAAAAVTRAVLLADRPVNVSLRPDPAYWRPNPPPALVADCRKLRAATGWEATTGPLEVVTRVVETAYERVLL